MRLFWETETNDVILSHMITFLNDKEDKNLRGSFFDGIIGVVGYVGWQSSDILIPLLQQGLTDSEEFVISKAIRATTSLIDMANSYSFHFKMCVLFKSSKFMDTARNLRIDLNNCKKVIGH